MVESKKATESLEINYRGQGGPGRLTGAQQNECREGGRHPSVVQEQGSAEELTGTSILMSARRSLLCDTHQLTWPLADSEGDAEMWGVVSFRPFGTGWDRVGAPCAASALGLGLHKGQGNEWADRCQE